MAIPGFHPNMGTAKSTLVGAWLGTRLREMRVIRLRRKSYTFTNRACTQTEPARCEGSFYRGSISVYGRECKFLVPIIRRLYR